jgi:hypothetical protein
VADGNRKFYDAFGFEHDLDALKCIGCGKHPRDIPAYVHFAKTLAKEPGEHEMSAEEYVMQEEGTLGMKGPNTFYCDSCYIAAGQPVWPNERPRSDAAKALFETLVDIPGVEVMVFPSHAAPQEDFDKFFGDLTDLLGGD